METEKAPEYFTELKPTKWQTLSNKLSDWFGCVYPTGLAYRSFNMIAGKLECTCCIFWRGLLIGLVLGFIIGGLIFY